MWLKDPKTGEKSVTLTFLVLIGGTALIKLALSGMAFSATIKFEAFSAADFATVFGAAAGFYWSRRNLNVNHDPVKKDQN